MEAPQGQLSDPKLPPAPLELQFMPIKGGGTFTAVISKDGGTTISLGLDVAS